MKINIAYFGTPDFSARLLEKLITDKRLPIDIQLVVTQPDKPIGRKAIPTPSPVKLIAQKYRIPVYEYLDQQNVRISQMSEQGSSDEALAMRGTKKDDRSRPVGMRVDLMSTFSLIEILKDIDLALLFAFGKIIPADILKIPNYGFWNVHPSLLPKYRGASPVTYPLILGEKETGVSIIQMDEQMDHGPLLAQEKVAIKDDETRPELTNRLTDRAFEMLYNLLSSCFASSTSFNQFQPVSTNIVPQDHKHATFTRLLKKEDGFIPLAVLKKALNNEPFVVEDLPKLVTEYLSKNSKFQIPNSKQTSNSHVINTKQVSLYHLKFENFDLNENCKFKIENSAIIIYNFYRGLSPWPGLWTLVKINGIEKRLKITSVSLALHATRFALHIHKVQLEGKREVDFSIFCRNYPEIF